MVDLIYRYSVSLFWLCRADNVINLCFMIGSFFWQSYHLLQIQGDEGARGAVGSPGIAGPKGAAGAAGLRGNKGAPGETGVQGAEGLRGSRGGRGAPGKEGKTGAKGAPVTGFHFSKYFQSVFFFTNTAACFNFRFILFGCIAILHCFLFANSGKLKAPPSSNGFFSKMLTENGETKLLLGNVLCWCKGLHNFQ